MNLDQLWKALQQENVELTVHGDKLRCSKNRVDVPVEIQVALAEYREQLLQRVQRQQ